MSFKTDLLSLTESFRKQNIDYAICGAAALAIHGFVRATPGIDVIVASNSINGAKEIAASRGFQPSNEKTTSGSMSMSNIARLFHDTS
jgi:hypothetical protein